MYVFHESRRYLWEDVDVFKYFNGLFVDGSFCSGSNRDEGVDVTAL